MPTASSRPSRFPGSLAWPVAAALLLVTPFLLFSIHHGYAPTQPELLLCLVVLAVVGLACGAVLARAGAALRVLLGGALVVLFVDFRFDWIDGWLGLGVVAAGSLLLVGLLREHVASIVCAACATLIAGAVLLPAGSEDADWGAPTEAAADGPPLLLHLILDEQIGIEGIPAEFDPDGEAAASLRGYYLGRGFQLFGRAISRYYDTHTSLSNLVNFSASPMPSRYFTGVFRQGAAVASNAYFEALTRRGYRIHVRQSPYVDFCRPAREVALASCRTFPDETITAVQDAALSVAQKARVIRGVYLRVSFLTQALASGYRRLQAAGGPAAALPAWDDHPTRVSALSAASMLEEVAVELRTSRRGSAYFVHLLLPHYPYVWDRACALRPSPREWLAASDAGASPRRNTDASRARRYPLYLDQVECVSARLDALFSGMPDFDEATIVVQGDHGSRIDRGPPHVANREVLTGADYLDGFSTLFAVKQPDRAPRYDRRVVPIDLLLAAVMGEEELPPPGETKGPRVFLAADPHWTARRARERSRASAATPSGAGEPDVR